jgi:hypothetical protein
MTFCLYNSWALDLLSAGSLHEEINMKLSFVFEDDEEVVVDATQPTNPVARVVVAVARPGQEGTIVLTREVSGQFGKREESKSFTGTEQDILTKHRAELLKFLADDETS